MDAWMGTATGNTYNFEPPSDLIQEEDCNVLILYLPGFKKEELRVQLTRSGMLRISGTRPIGDNKRSIFQKEFPLPENIDQNKISARFEDSTLYVRQPKVVVKKTPPLETPPQPQKAAEKIPAPETPRPPKPTEKTPASETPKPAEKPPAAKTEQERQPATKETAATADDIKQTGVKDAPEKSVEKKEGKSTKGDEKSRKVEGGKKDEAKQAAEKTGGAHDDQKKAAAATSDSGITKQMNAATPAARLKKAREKMTEILILVFVFALGIYLSRLSWFSTKAEN